MDKRENYRRCSHQKFDVFNDNSYMGAIHGMRFQLVNKERQSEATMTRSYDCYMAKRIAHLKAIVSAIFGLVMLSIP
jgi:hypothetical protein